MEQKYCGGNNFYYCKFKERQLYIESNREKLKISWRTIN